MPAWRCTSDAYHAAAVKNIRRCRIPQTGPAISKGMVPVIMSAVTSPNTLAGFAGDGRSAWSPHPR